MDMNYLVNQIKNTPVGPNLRFRQGKVITVNANYTIDVQIAGDPNTLPSVKYLSNYAPKPDDQVWLINNGPDLLGIGMIAGADRTLAPTASRSTNQTITTSTQTKIIFDSVDSDGWNCWDVSPNPTRLTVPVTGRYIITGNVAFEAASAGHRAINILKNNTLELARSDFNPVSNSIDTHSTVTCHAVSLTKGDYVELRAWQNSGSDLNILDSGDHSPKFSLIYLGS
jgi:hypothetical protein